MQRYHSQLDGQICLHFPASNVDLASWMTLAQKEQLDVEDSEVLKLEAEMGTFESGDMTRSLPRPET